MRRRIFHFFTRAAMKNKRIIAFLLLMLVFTGFLAAQNDDFSNTLNSHIQNILSIMTSNAVRGIACIFLIILCIGLITTGRQEPEMFKKFIPWIAGTVLFMAAGTITNKFLDADKTGTISETIFAK
jgi:type IV secretory pathway VirB2 component (pilin)